MSTDCTNDGLSVYALHLSIYLCAAAMLSVVHNAGLMRAVSRCSSG